MADFGDSDPEDAYDESDPPDERYRVILLWVASIALEQARADHDPERVYARIQAARWAVGLLRAAKLTKRREVIRRALADWLDDLLEASGG